jgi:malonyl-CoA/methylmalonyl-CoA synthetase
MPSDLYSCFAESFARHARRIFLEEDNGTLWTYEDVERASARLAANLLRLGLEPDDRVLVQTDKSPHALILYIACVRAGVMYLPVNGGYTDAELGYFIDDAQPKLTVCRPASQAIFARYTGLSRGIRVRTLGPNGTGTLFAGIDGEAYAPQLVRDPDDVVAILYTSGTTGRAKGAMLTHGNLVSNAQALVELWRFTPDDTLIHALPIFHGHGLFIAVHCALLSGARMIFLPRFDVATMVASMPRATVFMGVPTYYTRLLAYEGFDARSAANMRLFISGSAALPADTSRAFEALIGQRVLERYGMTETGILTSNPYVGQRLFGSVGVPLPGVTLRVMNAEGAPSLRGEPGEIEVKGSNVFTGYWRNPEKTKAEFRADGYFNTGDIGLFDENGYLHIVGRSKDLIITGGLNVYPKEIETLLDDMEIIEESAVIGVPHPDFGEAVIAVVKSAASGFDTEQLRATLRRSLAGFKVPKAIIVKSDLPRNALGKVQKHLLRAEFAGFFAGNNDRCNDDGGNGFSMKTGLETVDWRVEGAIGWVTVNNPARRNAISSAMWLPLAAAISALDTDPAVRVVIVRGAGKDSFASGADITELNRSVVGSAGSSQMAAAWEALSLLRKPLIAMIHGHCIGGGLALALKADLRIASADASIAIPAARLGVAYFPHAVRDLVNLVGPSQAKMLLFTAGAINAHEAWRIGIVNEVVPASALEERVRMLAALIAANAPLSILAAKAMVEAVVERTMADDRLGVLIDACANSRDFDEGIRAFSEKRNPTFLGR